MTKLLKNAKGLTLVELLAVIVILGIVAAIAIPAISGTIEKSKKNADAASVKMIQEAAIRYAIDNDYTSVVKADGDIATKLVGGGYLSNLKYQLQSKSTVSFNYFTLSLSSGQYTVNVFTSGDKPITEDNIKNGTVGD